MSLKQQAISGTIWTFAQQFSVQLINFVVQIILARLLMPEMFGLIAMLGIFIAIGQLLMDGGMTSSLIRTKKPDQLDYSTVFVTNFLVSFVVYLLVYFCAPFIAKFYHQDILKDILRVYALTFIIRSFVAVHIAKLTKEMNFKTQMILQVPSTIVGAIVGIVMAYLGYGVWSLVWLNLTQTIVFTIQTWIFIPWRPSFIFSKERFKEHFNFGYKLTLSGLLDTLYRNIYTIVVGKAFTPVQVGYFNQAETMRVFPVSQLSTVLGKVTYPLFSNLEDDQQLARAYKTTMKLVFFVTIPMMMILIVGAKELFLFLFGEKWLPAVPYFQVLGFASIIRPLSIYNLNILKVKGRSDLLLKLEIVKKALGFSAVFIAIPFGMTILVVSYMIISYINAFINMFFCGKLIQYSFARQIKDLAVLYIMGGISLIVTFQIRNLLITIIDSAFLQFIVIAFIFIVLYLSLIYLFEKETLKLIYKIMKKVK